MLKINLKQDRKKGHKRYLWVPIYLLYAHPKNSIQFNFFLSFTFFQYVSFVASITLNSIQDVYPFCKHSLYNTILCNMSKKSHDFLQQISIRVTYSVNVTDGTVGEIIINDQINSNEVHSSSHQLRTDQYPCLPWAEIFDSIISLQLN